MAKEYHKTTKDDIDFPGFCLYFIRELLESVEEANLKDNEELEVSITSYEFPYCSDAFSLVSRTLARKGFSCTMPTFKIEMDGKLKGYNYKWIIKPLGAYDDLPF
jgi:hypothetical protein